MTVIRPSNQHYPKMITYMYHCGFLFFFSLQLVLRDNDLTELPKTMGNLARLRELHLQNNRLTVLPPEMGILIIE